MSPRATRRSSPQEAGEPAEHCRQRSCGYKESFGSSNDARQSAAMLMKRREVIINAASLAAFGTTFVFPMRWIGMNKSQAATLKRVEVRHTSLLTAPIEIVGDWQRMLPGAVDLVVERMREASFAGVRTLSDQQPAWLQVELRKSGTPAIWLHPDDPGMAWIVVNIGERDWSKLAYQFGHELGHVFANSWQPDDKPGPPCQWLEEAMVEAFSLRGLGRLATDWKKKPPFAGDNAFGDAIAQYRENIVRDCVALADSQGLSRNAAAWFADHRGQIEAAALAPYGQAMAGVILAEFDAAPDCVEALGALNRWPGRTTVPIAEYFRRWETSCSEIGASARLPLRLRGLLDVA